MQEISLLAENRLASKEGLCSMRVCMGKSINNPQQFSVHLLSLTIVLALEIHFM
jgi:hypothetical protein